MTLEKLKSRFSEYGCTIIYAKELSPNDNSKNQVYLGGSFGVLNILPLKSITTEPAGGYRRERFKASLEFYWITDQGIAKAPDSQLIMYPKYPEVRFSGFLRRCDNPPSALMNSRDEGRILFFGRNNKDQVFGWITSSDTVIAKEFRALQKPEKSGLFSVLPITDNKDILLQRLKEIHQKDWIKSKRLDKDHNILDCLAPNCGGYTLEAELGVAPNSLSAPDFYGWEIKQFNVSNFNTMNGGAITLFTPEPTSGVYIESGIESFILKYGYPDHRGRENRKNFGGIHRYGLTQKLTGLKLIVTGFDPATDKITDTNGYIGLVDHNDNLAAGWDFSNLLLHWNRKHNHACFVPSNSTKNPYLQYRYGSRILLCSGTDFTLFLKSLIDLNVYYDPGIKIEYHSSGHFIKRRSQFRIMFKELTNLYLKHETVDLHSI